MRTSQPVAPIEAPAVAASLIAFVIVYFALFGAGTYCILKMMNKAPGGVGAGIRTALGL